MGESVHVVGTFGSFRLIRRSWYGGPEPDYTTLTKLTDDEAEALVKSGARDHLYHGSWEKVVESHNNIVRGQQERRERFFKQGRSFGFSDEVLAQMYDKPKAPKSRDSSELLRYR